MDEGDVRCLPACTRRSSWGRFVRSARRARRVEMEVVGGRVRGIAGVHC